MEKKARTIKHEFSSSGEPLKGTGCVARRLEAAGFDHMSTYLNEYDPTRGYFSMDPYKRIVAVRHPDRIPKHTEHDGHVEFGAPAGDKQVEISMAISDPEGSQKRAGAILDSIRTKGLSATSAEYGGVFGAGIEIESWVYDDAGVPQELPKETQIELQANMLETCTGQAVTPEDQKRMIAAQYREVAQATDGMQNNTSVPVSGDSPFAFNVNTQDGGMGEYIHTVQHHMYSNFFDTPLDPVARAFMHVVATKYGYDGDDAYDQFRRDKGNLSFWTVSAAHVSVGLAHFEDEAGKTSVGLEEAIAVADVFNSDMATVAEMMTFSTPVIYGERIPVDGKYPRDYRAIMKLASRTAYPGEFIGDADRYTEKCRAAIESGVADRIDRATYTHEDVSSAHGRVRVRTAYADLDNPDQKTGRIEFTGCGSTPDITALVARNSFLQLMSVYAYEAVAAGKHPTEHAAGAFPSLTTCDSHIELSHAYNFDGAVDPKVATVLQESQQFIDYMRAEYGADPDMEALCKEAERGIAKLTQPSKATTLDAFLAEGCHGSISDVITTMKQWRVTGPEIAQAVHNFQLAQANEILLNA
jgi:hypothetical protein